MRVFTGFLTSAVLEAIQGVKDGTIQVAIPGTAIQNGITAEQYKQALAAALLSVAHADDTVAVTNAVPTDVAAILAQYTLSYDVWLRHKEEVSPSDDVAFAMLRLYNDTRYVFSHEPNSNISDVQASSAVYTGLAICGAQKLDYSADNLPTEAIISRAVDVFGKGVVVKNNSITKLPKVDFVDAVDSLNEYASGSMKKANKRADAVRKNWLDTLVPLLQNFAYEGKTFKGYLVLFDATEGNPLPPLDSRLAYDFFKFDEISGPDSVLFATIDELNAPARSSCVVVATQGAVLALDSTEALGMPPVASSAMRLQSDHYVYTVGRNMLIKQQQVQQQLDARDDVANGGSKKTLSWLMWLLLILLGLALIVFLVWLFSDKKKEEPVTINVVASSTPAVQSDNQTNSQRAPLAKL